jgi:hypothetical protein
MPGGVELRYERTAPTYKISQLEAAGSADDGTCVTEVSAHAIRKIDSLFEDAQRSYRAGRFEAARVGFEDVEARVKLLYGHQHPKLLETRDYISRSYRSMGKIQEAAAWQAMLVELLILKLGVLHPKSSEAVEILCSDLHALSNVRQTVFGLGSAHCTAS